MKWVVSLEKLVSRCASRRLGERTAFPETLNEVAAKNPVLQWGENPI
jgi:hypothetical protein